MMRQSRRQVAGGRTRSACLRTVRSWSEQSGAKTIPDPAPTQQRFGETDEPCGPMGTITTGPRGQRTFKRPTWPTNRRTPNKQCKSRANTAPILEAPTRWQPVSIKGYALFRQRTNKHSIRSVGRRPRGDSKTCSQQYSTWESRKSSPLTNRATKAMTKKTLRTSDKHTSSIPSSHSSPKTCHSLTRWTRRNTVECDRR